MRLFCFHYGGGGASMYKDWAKDLVGGSDLVAIQLPGRENRFDEPLLNNVLEIANQLFLNFSSYCNEPYIFFGHSIGALISFEFTRLLRQKGMSQPKHLVVSGSKAPHVPYSRLPIHNLPDVELIDKLRQYNGTPNYILEDAELMAIFLPIIRADFCISETYRYNDTEPLTVPITALGGLSDNTLDIQDLLRWQEQTNSIFHYGLLPGDHFFIKPSYQSVIDIINEIIMSAAISKT